MTRKILVAIAFAWGSTIQVLAHATITVNELGVAGLTAQGLANALLAGNSGVTVSNVQFIGGNVQAGTFNGGTSAGLDFNTGIVLSSGRVVELPLQGGSYGASGELGAPGDSKLAGIVGAATNDAAVLKFDFVPDGDRIQFSYTFASTEYNSFVDSRFNDVLAFLVNHQNQAFVPLTATPVAINNVNCGQSSAAAPGGGTNCAYFTDNRADDSTVGKTIDINLGGFTKTFSFIADVHSHAKNAMYLAIADTSDDALDSAVSWRAAHSLRVGRRPAHLRRGARA